MRFYIILVFNFILTFTSFGQRNASWCFGDSVGIHFSTTSITSFLSSTKTQEVGSTISDLNGNLLLYSGSGLSNSLVVKIWNSQHQVINGGDSILSHSSITQGLLFLPSLYDTSNFFLFSLGTPSIGPGSNTLNLYYTLIDLNANGGNGQVVIANHLIDSINHTEKMYAIRHGNGRDWWLVTHELNSVNFVIYLFAGDSVVNTNIQPFGSVITPDDHMGQLCISPDGSKIALAGFGGKLDLFEFDRCTGIISNWIELGDALGSPGRYYGCSFSDQNKLYFSTPDSLWQIDATSINPLSTKTLLWTDDSNSVFIGQHLIGPDNKIYISHAVGLTFPNNFYDSLNTHLSVINYPNMNGISCNFTPYNVPLNYGRTVGGLPNIPNYELGSLLGSSCDTITNLIEQKKNDFHFEIYPNPNHGKLTINYKGDEDFDVNLFNLEGRIIKQTKDVKLKNFIWDISDLTDGIYFIQVKSDEFVINRKIILTKTD
jgi:hypothetical protein